MTVKIKVIGKVQGVYFRASSRNKAIDMGLTGYVKNEIDGSVSMIASGEKDQIDAFLRWCETGVDLARVDKIEHESIDSEEFNSFAIKR